MDTIIEISDDFDLEKIRTSGQCFRITKLDGNVYRLIARDKILFIEKIADGKFDVSCTIDEWEEFWAPYFDLDRNYASIRNRSVGKNSFVDRAMDYGEGLRILSQDAWEMLITFIISQRKNMPAIASAVEAISNRFGSVVDVSGDAGISSFLERRNLPKEVACVHAFPTPEQLASSNEADLRQCSLGYRAPYVLESAIQVASGEIDLQSMETLSDTDLFEQLQMFKGVGAKVANCVCLFGYGRTSQVPIDVWIARAIDEECGGADPFSQYAEDAGVMQQYVFFFMTDRNRNPAKNESPIGDGGSSKPDDPAGKAAIPTKSE